MTNYEFHLTVRYANHDKFVKFCDKLNIKPIILELYINDVILGDVMTSHTKKLDNDIQAYEELNNIKKSLENEGFNVVREKIEADYNHPNVPQTEKDLTGNPHKYLECHLNIEVNAQNDTLLKNLLIPRGFHISRNMFKKLDEKYYILMGTFRSNKLPFNEFKEYLTENISLLTDNGFKVHKEIVEFAIYDSNISWDESWLNNR